MWLSQTEGGALEKNFKPKDPEEAAAWEVEGCPVPTPVIPTTCWPQSEGSERQHPAGQRCGGAEQGNGVGRAETRDPFPLQRHKIPGKSFL